MRKEEVASSKHVVAGKPTATSRLQGDGTSEATSESTPPTSGARFVLGFPDGHWRTNSTAAINVGRPRQTHHHQRENSYCNRTN